MPQAQNWGLGNPSKASLELRRCVCVQRWVQWGAESQQRTVLCSECPEYSSTRVVRVGVFACWSLHCMGA